MTFLVLKKGAKYHRIQKGSPMMNKMWIHFWFALKDVERSDHSSKLTEGFIYDEQNVINTCWNVLSLIKINSVKSHLLTSRNLSHVVLVVTALLLTQVSTGSLFSALRIIKSDLKTSVKDLTEAILFFFFWGKLLTDLFQILNI